ncbi:histidine phosphatase family protein [Rhodobacteraceae bacterium W635]|uniref:histidine phosphatase family protein n=1 Tax=Nioella halotolerans TaxID=2303578 RepID=UPI000E3BED51|nr:histidine phosphatase family protein [Rhodobacteraceae bacterium W635]
MTVWHWVRHGPTHETSFVGWRDVPADLSDGAALVRLDAALPRPALLVSSDLVRASATADRLAAGRDRLDPVPGIREFDFGDWDGLHFTEVAERDPALSRRYWESPGDVAPPQGESWNTAAARVATFVDATNAAHPEAHVIAVAHFGVILTQVQRAAGCSAAEALSHRIEPLSVTRLVHEAGRWRVEAINHRP